MDVRLEGDEDDAGLESAIMILIKRREKSRVKLQDRNSKSHHDECLHVDGVGVSRPVVEWPSPATPFKRNLNAERGFPSTPDDDSGNNLSSRAEPPQPRLKQEAYRPVATMAMQITIYKLLGCR